MGDQIKMLASPFENFDRWYQEYRATGPLESTAMTLATVDAQGWPQARVVLLKNHEPSGFTFFTNYNSHKSNELTANPRAQLLFFWDTLARQVRVWGDITKASFQESDDYFASRSYVSQLGAWASDQSKPLGSRDELLSRVENFRSKYPEGQVPRPPHWGGWRLQPVSFEFWQGQENRLHDRFVYTLGADKKWQIQRLNP